MNGYKLNELMQDYEGFDWKNGDIVIVDQRSGKQFIIGVIDPIDEYLNKNVYSWTHSKNTMLLVF